MDIKTPKQVAKEWRGAFEVRDGDVQETSWSYIRGVIADAIAADRKQRERTLVVIAHRETWTNDEQAEVLDVDALLSFGGAEYDPEEVAEILAKLRHHGWDSIAEDVEAAEAERTR